MLMRATSRPDRTRHGATRRHADDNPAPLFERLEHRQLLSAAGQILFGGGSITIDGSTTVADTAQVSQNATHVLVSLKNANASHSKQFLKALVSRIVFNGHAGNDLFNNNSTVASTAQGGAGADRIYGQNGNDLLYGGAGDDWMTGQAGNDKLYGHKGNDKLYGYTGNDWLFGGSDNDMLSGWSGHDVLYGHNGNDKLYGHSGRDGLFGGNGVDVVNGGKDADRFLTIGSGDKLVDAGSSDAILKFKNKDRQWSYAEIELVDEAFHTLHHATKNTVLLKTHTGKKITFYRDDVHKKGWDAMNSGSASNKKITYYDDAFEGSDEWAIQSTYHEIAHNWDARGENGFVGAFRTVSNWLPIKISKDWIKATGGNWWYHKSATFARNYAKQSPKEDFAVSFAARFMGSDFVGNPGPGAIPAKIKVINDWLNTV